MYLKMSVAGHFKIFVTRTRGPFWSIRPARILLVAVLRHANRGDVDRGLWSVHAADRLGLGAGGMGLFCAVFPPQRPLKCWRIGFSIPSHQSKPCPR
jgi:hypothetical protein